MYRLPHRNSLCRLAVVTVTECRRERAVRGHVAGRVGVHRGPRCRCRTRSRGSRRLVDGPPGPGGCPEDSIDSQLPARRESKRFARSTPHRHRWPSSHCRSDPTPTTVSNCPDHTSSNTRWCLSAPTASGMPARVSSANRRVASENHRVLEWRAPAQSSDVRQTRGRRSADTGGALDPGSGECGMSLLSVRADRGINHELLLGMGTHKVVQ